MGAKSDYYNRAINLARKVDDAMDHHFKITDYWLGGGMAAAARIVTGAKTTTFNAAGVHSNTLAPFHRSRADADARMIDGRPLVNSYVVTGEALNSLHSLDAGQVEPPILPGSRRYAPAERSLSGQASLV